MCAVSKPLSILFLSRWLWDENRRTSGSGPTQHLAEALVDLGHNVVTLSQSPEVRGLEKASIGSLEIWLTPREKRRTGIVSVCDKLAKLAYKHRKVYSDAMDLNEFMKKRGPFDVVYAQSEEPDGLVAAVANQLGFRLPPVATQIHSLRYSFVHGKPRFNGKAALGLAFAQSTLVLANSAMVAQDAGKHYHRAAGKIRVLHPNLSTTFVESTHSRTKLPAEKNRILFLGALNEKKGAIVFLNSLVTCCNRSKLKMATFVVVGDFTEKNAKFEALWKTTLAQTRHALGVISPQLVIDIRGRISSKEVVAEIQRACVVVMPSLYDEFSRALAEVLVSGRPVVTTTSVGASELIAGATPAGIVVPPNDPQQLGDGISSALRADVPYASNARIIAETIQKQLSPVTIAEQLVTHLREAITLYPPAKSGGRAVDLPLSSSYK